MAVADDAKKPPPPPSRTLVVVRFVLVPALALGHVVAVLAFVRFVLAPMLTAFGRVVLVAGRALPYPCLVIAWAISAGLAATVVARRACRSGPLPFLEALKDAVFKLTVCIIILLLALATVLLCGLCLVSVVVAVSGSGSSET